jgi:hypothetical protein
MASAPAAIVCSKKSARLFSSQMNSARGRDMPHVSIRRAWRSEGCSTAEARSSARRAGGQRYSGDPSIGPALRVETDSLLW